MKKYLLCLILAIGAVLALAGGEVFAQYCIPPTKCTNCLGFGITKVAFNSINNTSSNSNAGYQNFTSVQTTVTVGQNYNLIIQSSAPAEQNFRAWIDWNDDKIFDNVNELVASCNQVLNCTASVNIPPNALFNTSLRMRVASDYYIESAPAPCDSLEYGQAEDYTVIVQQNTSPPVANFSAGNTTTCSGTVQFTDNSTNLPTQWLWDFGDSSSSSTLQNPSHTYSSSGTYSVTLIASNSFGNNTLIKNNYIIVNLAQNLLPISCSPATTDTSIDCGIYNVIFNAISNSTNGNTDGYKDYSCTKYTSVTEGMNYNISINTDAVNSADVRVWLDLNGDGELNDSSEKIFTSLNAKTHSGVINIPAATTYGIPLRMRVTSESAGNAITSCTNPLFGQVEDYGVTIIQFTGAPTADFISDHTNNCDSSVNFTDLSIGLPIVWNWNFGDGTTSNLQNPTHEYSASGTYTVTLTVSNQNGTDTIVKTNYIIFNQGPKPASSTPQTTNYCCGMGIYNVTLNSINNTTPNGIEGYEDYSCNIQTLLTAGQNHSISIITGSQYDENVRVWIDLNNSGTLNNNNELFFSSNNVWTNHSGTIFIPNSAVKNVPLRMRVASNYGGNQPPLPNQDVEFGQVEDYAVTIVNIVNAPVADFTVDSTNTCQGIVNFTDQSTNTPTSWLWDFGDGGTSTQKNPSYAYFVDGTYTVKLTASNSMGSNTKTKNSYITKSSAFCSGVGEEELETGSRKLEVFPNPTSGKFTLVIASEAKQPQTIEIYNILGEKVYATSPLSPLSIGERQGMRFIDLSAQPKGIYFLKISDGERAFTKKLLIE